jgi:hypothetical protein
MLEFEKQLKEGEENENRQDYDIFVVESEQDVKEIKVEETWLNSDRDYTYQEVYIFRQLCYKYAIFILSFYLIIYSF